jgi:hypothetical protein
MTVKLLGVYAVSLNFWKTNIMMDATEHLNELFNPIYHSDLLGGINQAQEETNLPFGLLANRVHTHFNQIQIFLDAGTYRLGSTGRRAMVKALAMEDRERLKNLIADAEDHKLPHTL